MRTLAALAAALVLAGCAGTDQRPEPAGDPQGASATDPDPEPAGDPQDASATDPATDPDAGSDPATDPGAAAELPAMPPFSTAQVTLIAPDGTRVRMPVYVADDDATRRQGLMGVTDLPRDAGMIFLTDEDRDHGFWMKDTLLPLSIAYLAADGTVVSVLDMEPCEADPCPSYPPGATYRHALEVHQGRFAELGLEEGWRVELPDRTPR